MCIYILLFYIVKVTEDNYDSNSTISPFHHTDYKTNNINTTNTNNTHNYDDTNVYGTFAYTSSSSSSSSLPLLYATDSSLNSSIQFNALLNNQT
jgi:hypothetical protein